MALMDSEQELNDARESWDLDKVYRGLVALGVHQLRSGVLAMGSASYRVTDPTDKRDVIHEAACSLVIQLKLNPSKRIDFWHTNMRYALKDAIRARKKAEAVTLEFRDEYGDVQSLYETREVL